MVAARNGAPDSARVLLIVHPEKEGDELRRLFENHPRIVVVSAANGVQAVAAARDVKPHAMIVDAWMPLMDGFEIFRLFIRDTELKSCRVIFVAGHAGKGALELAKDCGAFAWFMKPYSTRKIYAKTLEALGLPAGDAPPPRGD